MLSPISLSLSRRVDGTGARFDLRIPLSRSLKGVQLAWACLKSTPRFDAWKAGGGAVAEPDVVAGMVNIIAPLLCATKAVAPG